MISNIEMLSFNLLPWRNSIYRKKFAIFIMKYFVIIIISGIIFYFLHRNNSTIDNSNQLLLQEITKIQDKIKQIEINTQTVQQQKLLSNTLLENKNNLLWIKQKMHLIYQMLTAFPIDKGYLTKLDFAVVHTDQKNNIYNNYFYIQGMFFKVEDIKSINSFLTNKIKNLYSDSHNFEKSHTKIEKTNNFQFSYEYAD